MSPIVTDRVRFVVRHLRDFMNTCGYPQTEASFDSGRVHYRQITNAPKFTDGNDELSVHKLRVFHPSSLTAKKVVAQLQSNMGHIGSYEVGSYEVHLVVYELQIDGVITKFEGNDQEFSTDRVTFFGLGQIIERVDLVVEHAFTAARLGQMHFPPIRQPT